MEQHPIQVVVIAVFQLPKAGEEACRRSCQDALSQAPPLAVTGDSPLDAQEIVLARNCEAPTVPIPYGVWQTALLPRKSAPRWFQRRFRVYAGNRKYLPVAFQFKLMLRQPFLNEEPELFQLSLIRTEYREVVHVPDIVGAQPAVTDHLVQRLQNGVCEPLRGIRADTDAIFHNAPNQVEDAPVFNQAAHTAHHNLRFQAVVEMAHIAAQLVPSTFRVVVHPAFDCRPCLVRASVPDTAAAVMVHAPHEDWLQNLDKRVVDILVGPLRGFAHRSPLLGACVPSAGRVRRLLFKAVDDDLPQLLDALLFGFLHPSSAFIRAVVGAPMMCAVYFVDGS